LTKDITRAQSSSRPKQIDKKGIDGGYRRPNTATASNAKLSWRKRERPSSSHHINSNSGRRSADEEKKELLSAASKGLNRFAGDGTFLNTFANMDKSSRKEEERERTTVPEATTRERGSTTLDDVKTPSQEDLSMEASAPVLEDKTGAGAGSSNQDVKTNNLKMADLLRQRLKSGVSGTAAAASTAAPARTTTPSSSSREVVLPTVNAKGGLISQGMRGNHSSLQRGGEGEGKRFESHDKEGKRVSYFADDGADLQSLVREQKFGEAAGVDDVIMQNIAKRKNFKQEHIGPDEEYDNDATLSIIGQVSNKKKKSAKRIQSDESDKERQRQIFAYQRADRAQQQCPFCLSNPNRPKHLVVAIGQMAYLRMPLKRSIVEGYCLIVPIEHVPSTRVADDNTQIDIRNFKKAIIQMFASEGKSVVFMELAKGLDRNRTHTVVEAVPVPTDMIDQAPIFFKQAFDEMSSDWDQHHSKRLIETGPKGLQEKIPPNFPYFFVEFGLKRGFVHVIDNEDRFKHDFGSRILSGLLSTLPRGKRMQADQFKEKFKPFDWTAQLV
jgi:hypothetical protein